MARAALDFIQQGGHPKQFIPVLQDLPFAQGERKGEIMGFWGKKMLPQVFKWDDASKAVVVSSLDETSVLESAKAFIAQELQLENVAVVLGESDADESGAPVRRCRCRPPWSMRDQASSSIGGRIGGTEVSGAIFGSGGPGRCELV